MNDNFDYIVYVQTNRNSCITAINSSAFVSPDWGVEIDRGFGDKYHHAQNSYFPKGLYTDDGIPYYKLQDGQAVERTTEELNADRLPAAKVIKIAKSKDALDAYLSSHPLTWTDGKQYNITREKTGWLTSKVVAATAAAGIGVPYDLKWNDTGMVCEEWSLSDLTALALAIDARVTALVTYQQEKEIEIKAAHTMAELEAIVVDYDTIQ